MAGNNWKQMKTKNILLALLALALLSTPLAACRSTSRPQAVTAVTGTVTYQERIALPANAIITVQLQDISKADAPAVVLGSQVIQANGKQPPFPFSISYDPAQIQPNGRYTLRATITVDGQLIFTSTQAYPVITGGNPVKDVEIIVQRI
jgi:putative lipoprotein